MTVSQLLLAAAILVVFLLWRRARGQVAAAHADIEAHRARNTFTFEADETERAFLVRDADGRHIDPRTLRWQEHGLELVEAVARAPFAQELTPGTAVDLEPAADRVEVRVPASAVPIADIQGTAAAHVIRRVADAETGSCIVLRQPRADESILQLLVIHRAVDIEP